MSYVDKNLIPGESVLYRTGLHGIVLVWPSVLAVVFGLPGLILLLLPLEGKIDSPRATAMAGLLLLVIGAVAVLTGLVKRAATEMAVTNKRVVIKTGIVSRKTYEILLSKIESIGVEEGIIGRMLGYGSVIVRGTGGTPEAFYQIAHPLELRRQVQHQIEVYQSSGKAA
jgi:uncharacterized membrane protein YdbT with pleckstrin-like domain